MYFIFPFFQINGMLGWKGRNRKKKETKDIDIIFSFWCQKKSWFIDGKINFFFLPFLHSRHMLIAIQNISQDV